ncbi:hypothetical protein AB0I60_19050 [Actinosynnema sp. NPDC050436]|uniref:hypothetical protein n=1 Tax=Actinosynnema sp. NPDC050436 TaxID=3155659 RepID=UPI0033C608EB
MTSFPAAARRVRDDDLGLRDRVPALRECVLRFAPYGFRATWHHLVVGVAERRPFDPKSLRCAVDELEQARAVWLPKGADYAARRRREKAAGSRTPSRADRWHSWAGVLAFCPDFEKHPTERLVVVVRRVVAASESGTDPSTTCRACGRRLTKPRPCPDCGVAPPGLDARRFGIHDQTATRWREVWQRSTAHTTPDR